MTMKQLVSGAAVLTLMWSAAAASAPKPAYWVGTWACAPVAEPEKVKAGGGIEDGDSTVRDVVYVSLGGKLVRLRVSNEFGDGPLKVGVVHIAKSAAHPATSTQPGTDLDATVAGTDHIVTFGGATSFTIPKGTAMYSDPITMDVPPLSSLTVSIFVPKQSTRPTIHATALSSNFIAPGDQSAAATLTKATRLKTWVFLTGIDVDAPADAAAVVTLGDSITDGMISTVDGNTRWPNDLARRLQANPKTANIAVLNEGISGGRILYPQAGESMLVRFDRDVLGQTGVKYVIVYAGINDINHAQNRPDPLQHENADDMIAGLKQLIARAHAKGLKIFGATITAEGQSKFAKPSGEAQRQAVNAFIRSANSGYDGFFDFDKASRDPEHPDTLLPAYGGEASGHIHMFDAGYQALADAVDLNKFAK